MNYFGLFDRTVRYCLTNNKHFTFPADALPEKLQNQKHIVDLMANYMEQNLMEVRTLHVQMATSSIAFVFILDLSWKHLNKVFLNVTRVETSNVKTRHLQALPHCCCSGLRLTTP